MYELHCPACDSRGTSGVDRREIQTLATVHNDLIHRGQQIATVGKAIGPLRLGGRVPANPPGRRRPWHRRRQVEPEQLQDNPRP